METESNISSSSTANSATPADEAFARYLSNESSVAEVAVIEAWAASSPDRRNYLARMSAVWTAPSSRLQQWNNTRLWAGFDERRAGGKYERSHSRRRTSGYLWPLLAASLVVAIAGGGTWRIYTSKQEAPVSEKQYSTLPGQRANITLSDGSVVMLGVNSKLTLAPRFSNGDRQVALSGEGYFDVAHDPSAPFVVKSDGISVRVLGTSFNVRKYAGDMAASVAVAQGAVAVTEGTVERELGAGDIAKISKGDIAVVYDTAAVAAASGWRNGWLSLEDMRLDAAIPILERWYNLDIGLSDGALAGRHVSGSFRNESPDAVLRYLAEALNARFERKGQQITFYSR